MLINSVVQVFYILIDSLVPCPVNHWERAIQVCNYNDRFVHFSFEFYQFLPCIISCLHIGIIMTSSWIGPFFIMKFPYLLSVTFLILI